MNRFADLHAHTIFSDGTLLPKELIKEASLRDLCAISVVDHDTVEGLDQVLQEAAREGIEAISGIELTAEYESKEIHILGYLIDYKDPGFLKTLNTLKERRIDRVYAITEKLRCIGIKLDPKKVFDIAKAGTVGRLHIARAMKDEKLVANTQEAFQKFIGDEGPAYVCGFRFSVQEAIGLIRDVGGVAVLAHPYTIKQDELIAEFIRLGLMGLEVYYPEHSQSTINYYLKIAKESNLVVTGGSDFHGEAKPNVSLGCVRIPYELVERLKEAKEKQ